MRQSIRRRINGGLAAYQQRNLASMTAIESGSINQRARIVTGSTKSTGEEQPSATHLKSGAKAKIIEIINPNGMARLQLQINRNK